VFAGCDEHDAPNTQAEQARYEPLEEPRVPAGSRTARMAAERAVSCWRVAGLIVGRDSAGEPGHRVGDLSMLVRRRAQGLRRQGPVPAPERELMAARQPSWRRSRHGHRCRPDSRIRPSPIRAHRDMLRERRSVAELEEILAERLALLRPEPSARTSLSGSRRGKGTPPSDHDPRRRDTIEEGEGAGRALVAGFAADAAPPTPWACRPLRAGPRRGGAPLQPRQPEGQRPTKTS
jgi:hypothetical protein